VPRLALADQGFLSSAWIRCQTSPGIAQGKGVPCRPSRCDDHCHLRRKHFGGNFAGSLTAELEVLLKAAEVGCQIVDLEVESAEKATAAQLVKFRAGLQAAGTALLISFHDFSHTKNWNRQRNASRPSSRISSKWSPRPARWADNWPS